jgi:hypothetical protein
MTSYRVLSQKEEEEEEESFCISYGKMLEASKKKLIP